MMKGKTRLIEMQEPYLRALFTASRAPMRRRQLLQYGSSDQINAVNELVLNTLKNRVPLTLPQMARLRRYKESLREVGKRRNSIKKRRERLLSQTGSGFWQSLGDVCQCVLGWKK